MTKVVIVDGGGSVVFKVVGPTGAEHRRLANRVMEETLNGAGLAFDQITYLIATGYGRINVPFADTQVTELSCHAKGVVSLFPGVKTAIDIGGQDAKGLKIRKGRLVDFVMNDKCAAGTGRFLEVVADVLGLKMEALGDISLEATKKITISSVCTIFAQQEVITHLSDGVPLPDIVAGLHYAIANRTARMVRRLRIEPDVVFTGGVAKNVGVVNALRDSIGLNILVPQEPLFTGALGAALLGKERAMKAIVSGERLDIKERKLEEATFFE